MLDRAPLPSQLSGEQPIDEPFVSCAPDEYTVNWSERLEALHEHRSRVHFIDVWTRRAMLARIGRLPRASTIVDVGCSTGHLLADLRAQHPDARLVGVDLVVAGLRKAHKQVPDALLLHADACALPLEDTSANAIVSANLLEHVREDERALAEIFRVLRPRARAVIVVPMNPGIYDCYDRLLGHERRYRRGELARKGRSVGLTVVQDVHLGAPLYPAFWVVKQYNRRRGQGFDQATLERTVEAEIERTSDLALGRLTCRLEERLLRIGVRLPFGIRGLTVLERPGANA
jgi:SAM-dependent methyltransferase